ncbi:U9-ctenitoxin-Pr1a-like [Argiope bruennichi]|uniref:U9-ctenitoxin-Pr1a like protein n=1 Tax=Argiope bruennichi TaxID=94029 RepID=A0A8T0E923_ARGBR|nr:U9-ctenitoxin-Pr1a-like [Argiope bruennichi]KAF8767836.1 U9-ctenitoxin-Pr1a like protein [Argiope bruennichi]
MRTIFALFLLACAVFVAVTGEYCGSIPSCGEGQCCSGGFYHRYCRSYSDEGLPCEPPNEYDSYKVACPCKPGMFCNAIYRCQKEE